MTGEQLPHTPEARDIPNEFSEFVIRYSDPINLHNDSDLMRQAEYDIRRTDTRLEDEPRTIRCVMRKVIRMDRRGTPAYTGTYAYDVEVETDYGPSIVSYEPVPGSSDTPFLYIQMDKERGVSEKPYPVEQAAAFLDKLQGYESAGYLVKRQ